MRKCIILAFSVFVRYTSFCSHSLTPTLMRDEIRSSFSVEKDVRDVASEVADSLGLSLSAVVNQMLKDFARRGEITFTNYSQEDK